MMDAPPGGPHSAPPPAHAAAAPGPLPAMRRACARPATQARRPRGVAVCEGPPVQEPAGARGVCAQPGQSCGGCVHGEACAQGHTSACSGRGHGGGVARRCARTLPRHGCWTCGAAARSVLDTALPPALFATKQRVRRPAPPLPLATSAPPQETDQEYCELDSKKQQDDGTTAVTAVLVGKKLVIAHVGDSRCDVPSAGPFVRSLRPTSPSSPPRLRQLHKEPNEPAPSLSGGGGALPQPGGCAAAAGHARCCCSCGLPDAHNNCRAVSVSSAERYCRAATLPWPSRKTTSRRGRTSKRASRAQASASRPAALPPLPRICLTAQGRPQGRRRGGGTGWRRVASGSQGGPKRDTTSVPTPSRRLLSSVPDWSTELLNAPPTVQAAPWCGRGRGASAACWRCPAPLATGSSSATSSRTQKSAKCCWEIVSVAGLGGAGFGWGGEGGPEGWLAGAFCSGSRRSRRRSSATLRKRFTSPPWHPLHARPAEHEVLVLASDGLWDAMSNEEATRLAQKHRASGAQAAARALAVEAYARGSVDNITALCIFFKFSS